MCIYNPGAHNTQNGERIELYVHICVYSKMSLTAHTTDNGVRHMLSYKINIFILPRSL